jgi:hypothetical protein
VARRERNRWTLETACRPSEINTLGSPKAALFGLCLAVGADTILAVVLAAFRSVHGQASVEAAMSLYSCANDLSTTYHGMRIARPAVEWNVWSRMSTPELVATLLGLVRRVILWAYRKSPRGANKPSPKRDGSSKQGQVSTAKLLMARHG